MVLKGEGGARRWLVIPLFALAAACGGIEEPEAELSQLDGDIVGGTVDTGDPAVVAFAQGRDAFCTGTLIGRQTVLTAKHCLGSGTGYNVLFGTYVTQPSKIIAVERQVGHPSSDVAILKLTSPVADVAPIALNTSALSSSDIGETVRHVGFGVTSGNQRGFGVKRQVSTALRQVTSTEIESNAVGQGTCNGDSGGPAFMVTPGSGVERVAGVVSWGDSACRRLSWDVRVDVVAGWIGSTMGQWETAAPPPTPAPQDTVPPQVAITSPAAGAVLPAYSTLRVVARASDNVGVNRVQLFWASSNESIPCDNSVAGVTCTRSGDTYTWSLRVGQGTRSFQVTAFDGAGNRASSGSRTITLQ